MIRAARVVVVGLILGACGGGPGGNGTANFSLPVLDCIEDQVYVGILFTEEVDAEDVGFDLMGSPAGSIVFRSDSDLTYGSEISDMFSATRGSDNVEFYYKCKVPGGHVLLQAYDKKTNAPLASQEFDIVCHKGPPPEITVSNAQGMFGDGGQEGVGSQTAGVAFTRTYTVGNIGVGPLTLGTTTFTTQDNCTGVVTMQPASPVAPMTGTTPGTATMSVSVTPTAVGSFSCTWSLPNDDADENPFTIEVAGQVPAPLVPDLNVVGPGGSITDGGSEPLASKAAGVAFSQSYTLDNVGPGALTIGTVTISALTNCTVTITTAPSTSPLPGSTGTTMLVLSVTPLLPGAFSYNVSIPSDDPDENPYDFTASGSGVAPEIDVTGFADGSTDNAGPAGVLQPFMRSYAITNLGTANLTISSVVPQTGTNCISAVFTAPATTVAPTAGTSLTMTVTPQGVGAFSCPFQILNNDSDEGVYDITIAGTAVAPEIDISGMGGPIADGGSDAAGSHQATVAFTRTFTIANSGTSQLLLLGNTVVTTLTNCTMTVTQPPVSMIDPGNTTTFSVMVTPSAVGAFSCAFSVPNNDANEGSYDIAVTGTGTAAPAPRLRIVRTADIPHLGIDTVGNVDATSPTQLTYVAHNDGDAPLTITDITSASAFWMNCTVTVNTTPPLTIAPGLFATFSITVTPSSPGAFELQVDILSNDPATQAFGYLYSARGTAVVSPEIDILGFASGASDPVGSVSAGVALTRSYTIKNLGSGDLHPGAVTFTTNNCTATVQTAPAGTVAPNATTPIAINVTPTNPGTFSCTFHLANDDTTGNENPYDITISGTATAYIGNFGPMLGNYLGDNGCGLGDFILKNVNGLLVDSFGANPDNTPFIVGGNPNIATGTGLIIFAVSPHICTLTITNALTITVHCSNTMGGQCNEVCSKN